MRVILAGGGTGGHLFPGLAVAPLEFQRRDAMTEILFVGTEKGVETRVLPREGFRLETIDVKGLKGRGVRGLLDAVYGIPAGLRAIIGIVERFRPDCIRPRRLCIRTAAAGWEVARHPLRYHGTKPSTGLYQ